MEEFIKCDLEFENKELSLLVEQLRNTFDNSQLNFAKTCEGVYNIWKYCKDNYWRAKNNEWYNSYKILEKFGFDKKAVNRYKNCYEKFIYNPANDKKIHVGAEKICKVCIKPEFENFTPSKLFELLILSYDTALELVAKNLITPTMTVKQIREYIKTLKDGTDKADKVIEDNLINEEEIPEAYNPKQKYEFSYFETKTKAQLLNIVWELQKEYQKLKEKK